MLLINRVLGGRLPRWLAPVVAGAAMLFATISSEYGWYGRTIATLPEGLEVVTSVEHKALYQPWTYVRPYTDRFAAVDTATARQHPDRPDMRLGEVYFFGRWAPLNKMPVLVDCAAGRRAALADGADFAGAGVDGVDWIDAGVDDPIVAGFCGEAGP